MRAQRRARRAVAALALVWPTWVSTLATAAEERAPLALYLEVEARPKPSATIRASAAEAMLVLNAMPESRRELLADSLAKLAAVVNRKKNPFFVALDDSEERKVVEGLIAQTAPAFTAATTLVAGRWSSLEGDVQVRPVTRCTAGRRCFRLDADPSGDADEKRVRFLAWPLGYAIVLAVASRAELAPVAEALRAPGSFQIGLVLTSRELHALRASPSLPGLKRDARHLVKAMPGQRAGLVTTLSGMARAGAEPDALGWLQLPPDTLIVVPRLSALATPEQLVADVRSRLAAVPAKVTWLAWPR